MSFDCYIKNNYKMKLKVYLKIYGFLCASEERYKITVTCFKLHYKHFELYT